MFVFIYTLIFFHSFALSYACCIIQNMKDVLLILQTVCAAVLVIFILLQTKGTGFGRSWGGGTNVSFTRRGLEKVIFKLTFFVTSLFLVVSVLQLSA